MKTLHYLFALAVMSLISGCQESAQQSSTGGKTEQELSYMQEARGGRAEVIMVLDSSQWNGKLGNTLKGVFEEDISYLLNPEPMFTVRYILPWSFQGMLRKHSNIVMVATFDRNTAGTRVMKEFFTDESIERIKQDTSLFYMIKENEYARGQKIILLFSKNEEILINQIKNHKKQIQDFINEHEDERASKKLYEISTNKKAIKAFRALDCYVKVPNFYKLVPELNLAPEPVPFVWVRSPGVPGKAPDNNIFVSYKPYTSQEQFAKDSLIAWRDSLCRYHLFGDPEDTSSYLRTEKRMPIETEVTEINGQYAVKLNGLWQANNLSMGGVFNAYAIADPQRNRMYYVEGLIIALDLDKREPIREVDIIQQSFRLINQQE